MTISMWASLYSTAEFMVDDCTGEIYAMKGVDPQLIKEHGVLNDGEARGQFLRNLPPPTVKPVILTAGLVGLETGVIPKVTQESEKSKDDELKLAH